MNAYIAITGILILAVIFDLRTYRIPNLLTLVGVLISAGGSFCIKGSGGLPEILAGIGIPVAALFLLHRIRVLGAGDIKLLTVIGGAAGMEVLHIMLYSFLAGGALAMIHMLYHHNLVNRLQVFWNYVRTCLLTGHIIPYESGFDRGDTRYTVHFSIAILTGYAIWIIRRWLDF